MQELAVGWESSGKKRKMDPRILMSGMKEADGCRMTNAGEEGEHRSFLAIIFCRLSDQDRNPQMALS